MSEPMGLTIEVGGVLPANLIEEFTLAVYDECNDITGPLSEKDLRHEAGKNKTIKYYATSNYGECDGVKTFCRKHKLGYIHHCEAKYEYDSELHYWVPGMKKEVDLDSNQDSDLMVKVDKVKPLVDLLLEYANRGPDAFPLFVGIEGLESIVAKGLKAKSKQQALGIIEKRIHQLLPGIPRLESFTIKE